MENKMNLKGSRTEKNLKAAFAAESKARNAYRYYAEAARKLGHAFIADVFMEIAQNEEEHARTMFELLGKTKDTRTNLESAAQSEEWERGDGFSQRVLAALR